MVSKLNFFFKSTTIHGFRHMAVDEGKNLWRKCFSRIFWTIFISISILFMIRLLNSSLKTLNVTSINLDTNYRDWLNTFPGISMCLAKGSTADSIKSYLRVTTKGNVNMQIVRSYQSLMFLNRVGPTEGLKVDKFKEFKEKYGINITELKNIVLPQNCHDFMVNVTFLNKPIPCEKIFVRKETEIGTCFIANKMDKNLENFDGLPLVYQNNRSTERSLIINYVENKNWKYKLYIHSPEEHPSERLNPIELRTAGTLTFIGLKTVEIHNDEDVKFENIEVRKCRFPFEKIDDIPYSFASCVQIQRIKLEMKKCNCTLPIGDVNLFTKKSIILCDVEKFGCIEKLTKSMEGALFKSHIEDCLIPVCPSMEIIKIADYNEEIKDKSIGILNIEIMAKPTLRYIRRVAFTKLDIIVHLGGIVGLFIGASFISLMEIFFLCFDMRNKKKNTTDKD